MIEQLGNGGDLVGLLRNRELRQGQPGGGGVGAQGVQGFEPLAMIVGAARGLAVDGDDVMPARPELGDPALKAACEQGGIDAVHQVAQPARRECHGGTWRTAAENRDDARPIRQCPRNRRRKRSWRRSPAEAPPRWDRQRATPASRRRARKSAAKERPNEPAGLWSSTLVFISVLLESQHREGITDPPSTQNQPEPGR